MYSMGAVLHFRVCKGCVVGNGHSHLHSCSGHSHSAGAVHPGVSDVDMLPTPSGPMNGYQTLPAESRSDVSLLNSVDDDDNVANFTVQRAHGSTNVNIRAAMVHVIGDLIQSFGVLTAAIIILFKVCRTVKFTMRFSVFIEPAFFSGVLQVLPVETCMDKGAWWLGIV